MQLALEAEQRAQMQAMLDGRDAALEELQQHITEQRSVLSGTHRDCSHMVRDIHTC
jgi:hypothetical protein